jgi:hypothetical protein
VKRGQTAQVCGTIEQAAKKTSSASFRTQQLSNKQLVAQWGMTFRFRQTADPHVGLKLSSG